jgi:molecular chaperone DnaJ
MTAAALGTTMEIETLDGPYSLEIKPGTQSGTPVPIPGRGIPHLRGTGRGALIVHIEVHTPTKLDDDQRALLRELARLRDEEQPTVNLGSAQSGVFGKIRDIFGGR